MDGVNFLTAENRKKMEDLFRDCPQDVKDAVVLEKIPKKTYFIKAGGAASFIYILLSGRVEGIDFVGYGRVFSFREFDEGTVLGDYECLAGINNYTVSLQALEDCWFWVMPADTYLSWLNRDPHALMIRTHDLMRTLVVQTKKNRAKMLVDCRSRLMLYLTERYERYGCTDEMIVHKSRQELAENIGFCIKTINRNVARLKEEGYITIRKGKIACTGEQVAAMRNDLNELWQTS